MDDYLYHVTFSGRLPSIAEHGLQPGWSASIGSGAYDQHRAGGIFLTERDGGSFWFYSAELWGQSNSDDQIEDGFVPVALRVHEDAFDDDTCIEDEHGTRDARAGAYKCPITIDPEHLEVYDGASWIPLEDWESVDVQSAFEWVDEDGGYWWPKGGAMSSDSSPLNPFKPRSNPTPNDPKLYEKVKKEAKKKFDVWPSSPASSWLTAEYKRRGGTFKGKKPKKSGLTKWYDETWVDLARSIDPKTGKVRKWVECARPDQGEAAYPKCLPIEKARKMTPKQRLSAVRRKREAEREDKRTAKGRSPKAVSTFVENPDPCRCEPIAPHLYPVKKPIKEATFIKQVKDMCKKAKIEGKPTVRFTEELSVTHEHDARRYAHVYPYDLIFEFAPQSLCLPKKHREALIAHEIGHILDPEGGEEDADRAAEEAFGFKIDYDMRWPGIGLQVRGAQANPARELRDAAALRLFIGDEGGEEYVVLVDPEDPDEVLGAMWLSGIEQSGRFRYREVRKSAAHHGWGPTLYSLAMLIAGDDEAMVVPDRKEVSNEARAVWERFGKRKDVRSKKVPAKLRTHGDDVLDRGYVFAGFDEEAGRALERGARILGDDPYGERETLILEAADGFMRERVRRRNPKPRHATDLTDLRPDDIVTVYHGTRLSEAPALINGFDANKIQYRHYGGPRHAGLFVTPDFEVGRRFSDYGQLVFELHVPAKYLHGTDFSGNIQRIGDKDAATQRFYRGKYPKSFRPLLSDSMTDRGTEPQALLRGLVSPKQIARVYHTPEPHGDGTWYTREAFLNLGLEVTPPYGRPELLRDVEVDLSSPSMDYDAFVDAMASMLEVDRAKVTKALSWRAKQSTDKLQQIIESVGFGPTAARTYARRFGDQLQREANPGDITDLDKVRREKLREQRAEEKREVEAQIEQAMASIPEEELESPKERKARKKAERARARKERRAKKRGPHLKVVENPEQPKAAAGVLLVAADTGRVLLGLRSPEVRTPGVWSIIGGGVDEGETPKQAAVRELDEEVGYSGKIQRWKKGPTLGSDTMPFFTYVGFVRHEFTPMINWEHTDAAWFDPNDLPEPLHPTLKAFIEDRS